MMEEIKKRVLDNIDEDKLVQTLVDLVGMPSCEDLTKHTSEWEKQKCDYLENRIKEIGLDYVIPGEVNPGRPTLISFLRGSERKVKLGFMAHIDTQPPLDSDIMPHPWCATIKDGEVFGLGAGDSMPPLAAFLGAAEAIKKSNVQLKNDAMFVMEPAEFQYAKGIQLAIDWMKSNDVRPEFVIVGEPSGNDIAIVQRGVMCWEVEIKSVAGFMMLTEGEETEKGAAGFGNAVERALEVAQALKEMAEKESCFKITHSLVGGTGLRFGTITGGSKFPGLGHAMAPCETVKPGRRSRHMQFGVSALPILTPENCKLRFFMDTVPRERKPDEMFHMEAAKGLGREELEEMIDKHLKELWRKSPSRATYKLRCVLDYGEVYEISPEEPHIKVLKETVKEATGREPKIVAPPHWTEGGIVAEEFGGLPFVQLSPTWLRYHRPDESCPISELVDATRIYSLAILDFCGVV